MAIRILTDSSADYEQHELREKNILCIPISVSFSDGAYLDGRELSKDDFYGRLRDGEFPKTSQPSPESFLNHYLDAKESGDTLIAIVMSSGISGTYQSALIAKEMADYGGIYVIDSMRAVTGQRMLVDIAVKLRSEGKGAAEIVDTVESLKLKVRIVAVVDTLEYLYRGGRLSKAQARLGSLAQIKPIICVDESGQVHLTDKCIGLSRAYKRLCNYFTTEPRDENYPIYFTYSHNMENCEKFYNMVRDTYPDIGKAFYNIGPTVGTHVGENAFGFTFILK